MTGTGKWMEALVGLGITAGPVQSTTKLAGIYWHIPFCRQACNYCNFHFTTSLRYKDEMVAALAKEAEAEKGYLQGETVQTIYFGGGTPSLLAAAECERLLDVLHHHYKIAPGAEITLEANPDDITVQKLSGWKSMGINRLSIGIQSFFEEELRWMHRAHNAEQAMQGLQLALSYFDNITLDLIYGSPLLTDEMWQRNVETATGLGVPHLSCYALTVEERTPLDKAIKQQKTAAVDPDKAARQFLLLMDWLETKGYEHYEVSNFAKPGFRSRHNSAYWQGKPYLGLGPSAHSYKRGTRRWNVANNRLYLDGIASGEPVRETEVLTDVEQHNEYVMIALRTSEGLDLQTVRENWGAEKSDQIERRLGKFRDSGLIVLEAGRARLTKEGMLMADGLASDLFL